MNATDTADGSTETENVKGSIPIMPALLCEHNAPTQTASSIAADKVKPAPRVSVTRKPMLLLFAGSAAALIILFFGWRWWQHSRAWVGTDNAYVSAHVHTISTRVAGTVEAVLVDENDSVIAGQVIARLDARDLQVRAQQAEAQLAQAQAQHNQAKSKVAEAQAQLAREQAHAGKAKLDFDRANALFEGVSGAISKQEFDQATADYQATSAALQAAQAATNSASALVLAAEAQIAAAKANLEEARLQLSYTEIHAPVAGHIGKKNLEVGNRVQAGQSLLALVESEIWVTANFKETQLAHMKPGQVVNVRLDAFPGQVFPARVDSVSPATGAQFALLPPDNATGNFTRIVQRVPVKVVFVSNQLGSWANRLVPGMSAVVEVNVGRG